MRETQFIKQNKDKWGQFEKVVSSGKSDPEVLSNLYLEVTDDLSYARTFYPNRSVRVYLNGIAQRTFYSIYKNRRGGFGRFFNFWVSKVPQILYESRKELFFSLMVFLFAVGVGVLSTMMDEDFPRVILGDAYVNRTMENIAAGQPMSIYSQGESSDMFFQIAVNNLRVAALTFIVGLLFGVGTVYLLLYNGIIVGAFQMLFIRQGVYWESILTIWSHGTIEIACIIIAGGAGLALGRGLIFPNTFSRLQSLQLAARRGILIMATITPLIIFAAFIEGFFTGSMASMNTRFIVVGSSLALVVGYFILIPFIRARRGYISHLREVTLPTLKEEPINLHQIKTVSKVFSDMFTIFRDNVSGIFGLAAVAAAIYTTVLMQFGYKLKLGQSMQFIDVIEKALENMGQLLFPLDTFDVMWWLNVMGFGVMGAYSLYRLSFLVRLKTIDPKAKVEAVDTKKKAKKNGSKAEAKGVSIIVATLVAGLMAVGFNFVLSTNGVFVFLAMLSAFPLLLLWQTAATADGQHIFSALGKSFSLGFGNYVSMVGIFLLTVLMLFLFLFLATAPIVGLFSSVITTFIPMSFSLMRAAQEAFYVFINAFILFSSLPLVYLGLSVAYFSFRETREANDLHARLDEVGVKRRSYGMERE
jgi:uncharacterized membrane protein SpoIIM required for sporulation